MRISTKNMVLIGFALVLMLVSCLAYSSYSFLMDSSLRSKLYSSYTGHARKLSEATSDYGNAAFYFEKSMSFVGKPERDSEASFFFNEIEKLLESAKGQIKLILAVDNNANEHTELAKTIPLFDAFLTTLGELKEFFVSANEKELEIRKAGVKLTESLHAVTSFVQEKNIYPNLFPVVYQFTEDFFLIRLGLSLFMNNPKESTLATFEERLKKFRQSFDILKEKLQGVVDEKTINELEQFKELYATTSTSLTKNMSKVAEYNKKVSAIRENLEAIIQPVKKKMGELQNGTGDLILSNNQKGINSAIALSVTVFLIGFIISSVIVIRLVSTLKKLAAYATQVSQGIITSPLVLKESGEVGEVVAALNLIPKVLENISKDYLELESRIESGEMDVQADSRHYQGLFASLINGINSIITRYCILINNMPSPVAVLDKDLRARYLNMVASDLVGKDYKGRTCVELFNREDYGSDDAVSRSAKTRAVQFGETVIHSGNKTLDVSYASIPFLDKKGDISAFCLLMTDLTQIKKTQKVINETVKEATIIADRVASASEELSSQMQNVHEGAEHQLKCVSLTVKSMEDMNSSVRDVANNAGKVSEQTESTKNKAIEGSEIVSGVINTINEVNTISINLEKDMLELGNKAEEVGSVMGVIADIADQTNLLALNAAIEAARAGDAGRGFAVVADEVRKLAEKTMSATTEVGAVISAIQASATKNINNVGSSAGRIKEATKQAGDAGRSLQEIVSLVNENATLITTIAEASNEQSATSDEVNSSLSEVSRIVEETSESVDQSYKAVDDLSETALALKAVLNRLG